MFYLAKPIDTGKFERINLRDPLGVLKGKTFANGNPRYILVFQDIILAATDDYDNASLHCYEWHLLDKENEDYYNSLAWEPYYEIIDGPDPEWEEAVQRLLGSAQGAETNGQPIDDGPESMRTGFSG